jgi:hypothetical protein
MSFTINFNGKEYTLDRDAMTLEEAAIIYDKCGITFINLSDEILKGNPHAYRAMYWLMLRQNGKPRVTMEQANCKASDFMAAFIEALRTSAADSADDEANADPKDGQETSDVSLAVARD